MTAVEMLEAILRVAALALLFGAGVPALFALGMRAHAGKAIRDESGTVVDDAEPSSGMKLVGWAVYVALATVIFLGIVWLAKDSIGFYTGWHPFGSLGSSH